MNEQRQEAYSGEHSWTLLTHSSMDQELKTGGHSHLERHSAPISALIPTISSQSQPRTETKLAQLFCTVKLINILASPQDSISMEHEISRC